MDNKKVLLTGATAGIGRALALKLAEAEYTLALCGRSKEKMESLKSDLGRTASRSFLRRFEMTDFDALDAFCRDSIETIGLPDIVINNAGANNSRAGVHELASEDLEFMLKLNCVAPARILNHILPAMYERGSGMIVNILSTTCKFSNPGISGYTASKTAFDGYTGVLRKEAAEYGVKVLSIYPGGVDTDFREASRPLYLSPEAAAEAIFSAIRMSGNNGTVHELVIRPDSEKNFG